MNVYVDTNALVRHYLGLGEQDHFAAVLTNSVSSDAAFVPVTEITRMEVSNAIERMVFETRHGGTARVAPEMALVAHGDFQADLEDGRLVRSVPLTLADIEMEFDTLVRRYTALHGFRTYDIIHVSSALKLKCRRFLSFDQKANQLARLVGLKTL